VTALVQIGNNSPSSALCSMITAKSAVNLTYSLQIVDINMLFHSKPKCCLFSCRFSKPVAASDAMQ